MRSRPVPLRVHSSCLPAPKALAALGSDAQHALLDADRELSCAPRCRCCTSLRAHLARFVGSTLFFDDDPAQLQRALPPGESARWTVRLLAACIVRYGRARVGLFERA